MKPVFLIILSSFFGISCLSQTGNANYTKTDSLLIEKIKKQRPKNYQGSLLKDYLSDSILKKYKEWIASDEPPGKLHSVLILYSKKVWVEVIFDEILYQKKFNIKRKWDFNLLKKEKIYRIFLSWEN